jgi:hypothetical protein
VHISVEAAQGEGGRGGERRHKAREQRGDGEGCGGRRVGIRTTRLRGMWRMETRDKVNQVKRDVEDGEEG